MPLEEYFAINGGNELFGKVELHGAKNAVLPMLAAGLLTKEEVVVKDCPYITDVSNMGRLLAEVGANVLFDGRNIRVRGQACKGALSHELEKVMRSSMFMLGVLIATVGEVKLSLPGGCKIGARPLDIHLDGLSKLGAVCEEKDGVVFCHAKKLKGAKILMRYPSVGATENLLMASVLAEGKTTLVNCAREPEIISLVELLRKMGAKISGEGTSVIEIDGVKELGGATVKPIADRIVAGTYLGALAVCGGELVLNGIGKNDVRSTLFAFQNRDFQVYDDGLSLRARATRRKRYDELSEQLACDVITGPYPLFATDMQPVVCAVKCFADGVSRVKETVFENRFSHLFEMKKLGADVVIDKDTALIRRGDLYPGDMIAKDLRGGAGLSVFAMGIKGESRVYGAKYVDRGYENFEENFKNIGCDIRREPVKKC
ncbi:MAG: UDP-N-acetylglucosamine 1-carboxyvinyltransferase [Clostridia bacterium]|nr:UDP-N-acetylglucosamine 1-carboxyvinyltransferase [Clostridia bacterium]